MSTASIDPHDALELRAMAREDCAMLGNVFASASGRNRKSTLEGYCDEQAAGERWTCTAAVGGSLVGYVTVRWRSDDPELAAAGIPEILDLNVLPEFRGRGIGLRLLEEAERVVSERADRVGLRVGLHPGYGSAQRLYVRRGYLPDGRGAVYGTHALVEGAPTILDDELTLRLTKSLSRENASGYLRELRQAIGNRLLLLPSVAVAVQDDQGRLLMVRHAETDDWGIPGGAIEPGEPPENTARRELEEETAVRVDSLELLAALGGAAFRHVYANGDQVEYAIVLFGGRARGVEPVADGVEISDVRFFARVNAPRLKWPYPADLLWRTPVG